MSVLQGDVVDLRRQSTKKQLVLSGPDLPAECAGEKTKDLFISLVSKRFGIEITHSMISQAHRIRAGGILAEFIYRDQDSAFQKLLSVGLTRPKPGEKNIQARLHLMGSDKHLNHICSTMKRMSDIDGWNWNGMSGKPEVEKDGKKITIQSKNHLLSFASDKSLSQIFKFKGK